MLSGPEVDLAHRAVSPKPWQVGFDVYQFNAARRPWRQKLLPAEKKPEETIVIAADGPTNQQPCI